MPQERENIYSAGNSHLSVTRTAKFCGLPSASLPYGISAEQQASESKLFPALQYVPSSLLRPPKRQVPPAVCHVFRSAGPLCGQW